MDIVVKTNKKKIRKFGLALGGGGARGFAHIGALKAFEEAGIKFDYVAGTSIGSLIGAAYCMGKTADEILAYALTLKERDIKTSKIPLTPSKSDGLEKVAKNFLGDINFSELKIPFTAVAVDIRTGEEVHITEGNLAKAIAGSCAVPLVFYPVEFEGKLLFDGGLQNNIPANVPKLNGCEITIGIDINSTRGSGTDSSNYFHLVGQAIGVMMKSNCIKGYLNADIMIQPDMKRFKSTSFDGAVQMFEEGYLATKARIPEIMELYSKRKVKKSFWSFLNFKKKGKDFEQVNLIEKDENVDDEKSTVFTESPKE